jgi:glycosyltransferase involved in cell wall biosynthesis
MEKILFFSIIVPTYNQSHFIKDCVNSILNQTFSNYELIVSDDSNNDKTSLLVESNFSDTRIRYFKNTERLGRVSNYRKCVMERALGLYGLICDGDDFFIDPTFLQSCYDLISEHKGQIAFIQAGKMEGSNLLESIPRLPEIEDEITEIDAGHYIEEIDKLNHFSHAATIFNLDLIRGVNPYSKDIISSDRETMTRLSFIGKVFMIKKPVVFWRKHNENASSTLDINERVKNLIWIDSSINWAVQNNFIKVRRARELKKSLKRDRIISVSKFCLNRVKDLERPITFSELMTIVRFLSINFFRVEKKSRDIFKSIAVRLARRYLLDINMINSHKQSS